MLANAADAVPVQGQFSMIHAQKKVLQRSVAARHLQELEKGRNAARHSRRPDGWSPAAAASYSPPDFQGQGPVRTPSPLQL